MNQLDEAMSAYLAAARACDEAEAKREAILQWLADEITRVEHRVRHAHTPADFDYFCGRRDALMDAKDQLVSPS